MLNLSRIGTTNVMYLKYRNSEFVHVSVFVTEMLYVPIGLGTVLASLFWAAGESVTNVLQFYSLFI